MSSSFFVVDNFQGDVLNVLVVECLDDLSKWTFPQIVYHFVAKCNMIFRHYFESSTPIVEPIIWLNIWSPLIFFSIQPNKIHFRIIQNFILFIVAQLGTEILQGLLRCYWSLQRVPCLLEVLVASLDNLIFILLLLSLGGIVLLMTVMSSAFACKKRINIRALDVN